MKILMLVNWKIKYCDQVPDNLQPPDYYITGQDYWFYRYFKEKPEVDVLDIHSIPCLEYFEKNFLKFYIVQALKAIPHLNRYDLIVSHGMQSGIVISLWRRLFEGKTKHIVFDIGSFASASESGFQLKLMQFASKSIDGIIYHTSSQINYYKNHFPWIVNKGTFVRFGTDLEYFNPMAHSKENGADKYILCVGYAKRDWGTLATAYSQLNTTVRLRFIGYVDQKFSNIKGIEQVSFIPIQELIDQIYNAEFCVLPLKDFNYSYGQMTLMQQMALGKCVIAANVSSLADYIQDGKTAILYEAGNASLLSEKMELVLNDIALRNQIGENARLFLQNHCNERCMAQDIEAAFRCYYETAKE